MKSKIALLFLATTLASPAAVTLGFSTASNVAEGWANSSGSKSATMVWGIIVDTLGDGFDGLASASTTAVDGGLLYSGFRSYDGGFSLTPTSTLPGGQLLNVGGIASDDRLYISQNLMELNGGDVRITSLGGMVYDGNTAAGDKYAIVWFDSTTLGSVFPSLGVKMGAWSHPGSEPATSTTLPSDPGTYTNAANGPAGMFGPDGAASTKQALLFVPEPSTLLLGLLGATSLLRRRR